VCADGWSAGETDASRTATGDSNWHSGVRPAKDGHSRSAAQWPDCAAECCSTCCCQYRWRLLHGQHGSSHCCSSYRYEYDCCCGASHNSPFVARFLVCLASADNSSTVNCVTGVVGGRVTAGKHAQVTKGQLRRQSDGEYTVTSETLESSK
jgi:hypothetical protein